MARPNVLPKLGEPTTCDEPCEHRDCAEWRKRIGIACTTCGEPMAEGDYYYGGTYTQESGREPDIEHAFHVFDERFPRNVSELS